MSKRNKNYQQPDFTQRPEFHRLQRHWYDKLKQEGFEDIEYLNNKGSSGQDSDYIKDNSYQTSSSYRADVAEYYSACQQFLHKFKNFRSQRDRFIWYWHSEGYSRREISEKIQQAINKYYSYVSVHNTIKRYERQATMRLKYVVVPRLDDARRQELKNK